MPLARFCVVSQNRYTSGMADRAEQSPAARPAVAAALLAIALYAITLFGTYVYDDVVVVRDDSRVTQLNGWIGYFRAPYLIGTPDPLWRPLTCLTYWAQYHLHGPTPWPFHLVNILLHAAVSALIAIVAWQLTRRQAAAWWAGLLFAAHPVHVEAVAYLVGRAESLCTLGVLGGIALFVYRPLTPRRVVGIVGCFVLAAMSKEHGVLLPPMLLLIAVVRRYLDGDRLALAEREPAKWLFVGLTFCTLAYAWSREHIMHLSWDTWFLQWTINPLVLAHGLDRALLPLSILGRYAAILLLPLHPSPDYGANITGYVLRANDPYLYLGGSIALAALVLLVIAILRRWTAVLICLGGAAIAYALISNSFMLIGIVMGERLIYLTSAFVILLIAMALSRLPARVGIAIGCVVLSAASLRTVTYAWRWNDDLRLFSLSRAEHPDSIYLHVLEASTRCDRGDLDGAERVAAAGRKLQPKSQNIWAVSARIAKARGDDSAAAIYGAFAFDLANNPPQATKRLSHITLPPLPASASTSQP